MCFYEGNTPVVLLDSTNFDKLVMQSNDIWLIEFYAPWCGHCQAFAPEYEKAARALKGVFKIGAVNADQEKQIGGRFGISGFPTVKYFGINKKNVSDYKGPRTADGIINFMFSKAKEIVDVRLGKSSTNNNSGYQQQHQQHHQQPNTDKDVIVLDDDNFDSTIYNSEEMWVVAFYAPWCGHCQKLLPEWNAAASQLKGTIKLAKVDADKNKKLSSRFRIQGYPTIKIFAPGKNNKSDSKAEEYQGPRETAGIVQFLLGKLESFGFVPEIKQLTNENLLKENCKDRNGICVISFLPHIADSNKNERNRYIEEIKQASKSARGKPIYYLWAQGGDFFDLEDKLHLSFGYPATIALNYNKKKYGVNRRSFSKENLEDFVSNLLMGREPLNNLPEIPNLKKVDEWDGNDYVPPKEENEEKSNDL